MTTPQFVDISVFQPANIDWQAYKQWSAQGDGISRVALRSSYGVGYADVHFAQYRQGALNAGIDQIIFYHYAYPSLNNAVSEANSQHDIVGRIRPQDMVILDFEENVDAATADWAYTWLAIAETWYKLPGLYASSAYIQQRLQDARLARYPLWLANWQFTPDERPPVPSPWQKYEFVQYTDNATNVPGIASSVDADIFLGVSLPTPQPLEDPIVTIDLSNSTVASHFTGDANQWTCKETKFTLHGEILAFYQSYGGNALCGLTHLGLPLSGETPVPNRPGIVWQAFERGVLIFDPDHIIDNPPGSGRVYLMHIDSGLGMDPRIAQLTNQNMALTNQIATLQGENAALKALPIVANMQQIQAIGKTVKQTINDDIDLIMKLATVI